MNTGQRIKARRIQMDMSQQDLADMVSTDQKQIWRYENGKNDPTGAMIIAIAHALNVSADWLLGLSDVIKPFEGAPDLSDDERYLISLYRSKTEDKQHTLLEVAKVV